MKFFLDTANLEQIQQGVALGIIDGVTTNPSLMAKEGIEGHEAVEAHYRRICEIVDGDVSAEVLSTDYEGMIAEGTALAALHPNIVVKIPCTEAGIRAIKYFAGKKIRTNCTLIFSVGQAVLAAKAGASYVSPFVGRLDDISEDGIGLAASIVETFETYGYGRACEGVDAWIRSASHISERVEVGARTGEGRLKAILGLLQHPLTDKGLAQFIRDSEKLR